MTRKVTRYLGPVRSTGEDGREVMVRFYQVFSVFEPLDGGRAEELPGTWWMTLSDGSSCSVVDEDTVRVDATGEVLRIAW